jgi:nitrogen fixation NifU-like protein
MRKKSRQRKMIVDDLIANPMHSRRMNAPDACSFLKGPCGDEMEFYLIIENNKIKEISFFTTGCEATIACGEMLCRLAEGLDIDEALGINPRQIGNKIKVLDQGHKHCPILSVSTFYKAIAEYMLMP